MLAWGGLFESTLGENSVSKAGTVGHLEKAGCMKLVCGDHGILNLF